MPSHRLRFVRARRLACALALALPLAALAPGAAAQTPASMADAERLRRFFELAFEGQGLEVEVLPLPAGGLAVLLRGTLGSVAERDAAIEEARRIAPPSAVVLPRLAVRPPAPPPRPPDETEIWTLTYVRSRVGSRAGEAARRPDNVDQLVEALNDAYGTPGAPAVQRAGSGRLVLRGSPETLLALQRLLVLVDAPWPQVQMNLWAIQVSGSPEQIADEVSRILVASSRTREDLDRVQRLLAGVVIEPADAEHVAVLREEFGKAGVDLDPCGALSLNESLVLLTLHSDRQAKVRRLRERVREALPEVAAEPFTRLERVLGGETWQAENDAFTAFGAALACYKQRAGCRDARDAPRRLVRTGATVDRILKSVMDAFATDMDELLLAPLLDEVRHGATRRTGRGGTALVGRTRIVVSSGLEAGLEPEMVSGAEATRAEPLTDRVLERLTAPAEGAGPSVVGLSEREAALLAAAVFSEPEPAWARVAPGIALRLRPTVLPDGGAARLTIEAAFGLATEPPGEGGGELWSRPTPDAVVSHRIETDAAVSAFDLFDVSSFSVATSHPRSPFYVPVLSGLPLVGRMFQIPRRNRTVHHESLILVNTVILPRSLELHRFYGRGAAGPADPFRPRCPGESAAPDGSR